MFFFNKKRLKYMRIPNSACFFRLFEYIVCPIKNFVCVINYAVNYHCVLGALMKLYCLR